MRGIISTLLIAAAAVLFMSAEASASWTCKAYGPAGNYGWGTEDTQGAASQRALAECNNRGGGCQITGCQGSNPAVRPTPAPSGNYRDPPRDNYAVSCPKHYYKCSLNAGGKIDPKHPGCCWDLTTDPPKAPVVEYKKCPNGERVPVSRNCPTVVEYKRCPNGERVPVSSTCPCPPGHRMGDNDRCYEVVQRCPDGSRMPSSGNCPCREGQVRNSAGDCYTPTVHTPPPPPPPREAGIRCDLGPAAGYPSAGDLPRSIYEIKVGNTSLFAGGYADIAPNRNDCKGVTANGCYLRVVNVPKVSGGSSEACVQFCKTELCPPKQVKTLNPPPPPPLVSRIPDERPPPPPTGKPAVPTLVAPPYVAPAAKGKPAVPTLIAAPYVARAAKGRPAVPTVIAPPYVVPAANR